MHVIGAPADVSVEPEDGREGFVDAPELFGAEVATELSETGCVDLAELLDEDSGCLSV